MTDGEQKIIALLTEIRDALVNRGAIDPTLRDWA